MAIGGGCGHALDGPTSLFIVGIVLSLVAYRRMKP